MPTTEKSQQCPDCGRATSRKSGYCSKCHWNHGTVWILHMTDNIEDEWIWTKEER